MDSGGGFIIPNSIALSNKEEENNASSSNLNARQEEPVEVRRLTQKQEIRLMNYLDDAFQQIVRGYAKRYTASNLSQIPTVSAYLEKMESILHIIIGIPPVGPSLQLLLNYLLRFTNEILDGIPGYELGRNGDVEKVSKDLENVVESLDLLDRIWSAILRGKMIDWQNAKENVKSATNSTSNVLSFPPPTIGTPISISNADGESALRNEGRYPPKSSNEFYKTDNHQIIGSRGYSTVGQTQRIRLRNVITLAKETLFTWMRTQLDAPLPPQIQNSEQESKEETSELIDKEGDLETNKQNVVEGDLLNEENEDGDVQLEDVEVDQKKDEQEEVGLSENEQKSNEHTHYDDLFARKIDPDEDGEEEDEDRSPNQIHTLGKRSHTTRDIESNANKRFHPSQQSTTTLPSSSKAESQATLNGVSGPNAIAVMRWDVAFARLFQKTLRCLSDIQDRSEQQTTATSTKNNPMEK